MNGLTWLHLSDWHQKGREFNRTVVRDALLRDLRQRADIDPTLAEVDFVIFSGDVAFHGKKEEFETAREVLFDPVLEALDLKPDKLFIIPGNHDLSRPHVEEMLPEALKKPFTDETQVQHWLTEEKRRNRALEPFEDFAAFVIGYTKQDPPAYANTWSGFIGMKTVGILCLNSAWMCGRKKEANGEVNDYGFLTLGEPQLHEALEAISGADVRLAVLHHPFPWLAPFDNNRIEERLKRECHFILHGHEHVPNFNLGHGLSGHCAVIPAGACYERRTAADPRYTNAYNFVRLDFDTGQGVIFLRRWSDRRNEWLEDTDSHPGGRFPFTLPKELGKVTPPRATPPVEASPSSQTPVPRRVFICYRRDDSAGHAGRLFDKLCGHFGAEQVFMDFDKIKPGEEFLAVIKRAIMSCDAMLVLIGRRWLSATDANGGRRLDAADDPIRFEIETALRSCPTVIPVLVQAATLPRAEQLPDSIKKLVQHHALDLSDSRWEFDVTRLVETLALAAPAASPAITLYRERLLEEVSRLELIGLGHGVQLSLPINQAYVPLRVVGTRDLHQQDEGRFDEERLKEHARCDLDVRLCEVFKQAARFGERGVLLLGDPGAGKTTGARQFCWQALTEPDLPKALGLPAGTAPVFLRLRHVTVQHLAKGLEAFVTEALAASMQPQDHANPAPDLLARDRVLWIFDGLDEVVSEPARIRVCAWITRALKDRPRDHFLVTSRYQGYQGEVRLGPEFCKFHVRPLEFPQIGEFVDRWYRTVYGCLHGDDLAALAQAGNEARALLELLEQPAYRIGRLRELPRNPLLLTILCLVHHQDHNLPRRRAALYARCVRVLLEHWRREFRKLQAVEPFDPDAAEGVLAAVAWHLHGQEKRITQTLPELGVVAGRSLANVAPAAGLGRDGETFIARMKDECGILALWGAGQCGFLHLGFQEYLAGLHAAREGKAEDLVKKTGQSWWREVVMVAAALGSQEFAMKWFAALLRTDAVEQHPDWVDQCLDEAGYPVIEPFLDAIREAKDRPDRQLAILRRLRHLPHDDLTVVCRDLAQADHPELAALAREILQRAGVEVAKPMIEVLDSALEVSVDGKTGIAFITIPAGEFDMGSNEFDSARPIHRVRITQPFRLGKYPVTNAEYQQFLEAISGTKPPAYWNDSRYNDPQQPVLGVSWHDAQAFCAWAGGRLPSEAEWEYACRAGSPGRYCFGDDVAQLGEYAWYADNSGYKLHPVGQKKPNDWGLHDMHGNVWEWCEDAWDAGAYQKRQAGATDPRVTSADERAGRVVRGGSWGVRARVCRAAVRGGYGPGLRTADLGLRLAAGQEPPSAERPNLRREARERRGQRPPPPTLTI